MRRYSTRKKQNPYVLLIKATNTVVISTTKLFIANTLGIHSLTISRNMKGRLIYDTEEYTIWKNIPIHRGKVRGSSKQS